MSPQEVLEFFKMRWPIPPLTRVMLKGHPETANWEGYFTGGFIRINAGGLIYLQIVWFSRGEGWGTHPVEAVRAPTDKSPPVMMQVPYRSMGEIDRTTTELASTVIPWVPVKQVVPPRRLVVKTAPPSPAKKRLVLRKTPLIVERQPQPVKRTLVLKKRK